MNKAFYLIRPGASDESAIKSLVEKWRVFGGRMNPGLLRKYNGDYSAWLSYVENCSQGIDIADEVPQTLYLLKDTSGAILGAASIRHYLNHTNIIDGGHIGYGIAPEHRGKGYGNLILKLALEKMREMHIDRVLVTCDADNFASQKVIINNGGVLENQTHDEDGILINRYWIDNIEN